MTVNNVLCKTYRTLATMCWKIVMTASIALAFSSLRIFIAPKWLKQNFVSIKRALLAINSKSLHLSKKLAIIFLEVSLKIWAFAML